MKTFRPDQAVTRAQAAIMIGRTLELNDTPRNSGFTDVTSNVTGSGYIASAIEKGILTGFPDEVRIDQMNLWNRGQMAIFLNRAFPQAESERIVLVMFLLIWQPINRFLMWLGLPV